MMLHTITYIYRDITKKETEQASLLIQGLHVNFKSNKSVGTSHVTPNVYIPLQPTMSLDPTTLTMVPEYPKDIHPRPYQVCNCDNIIFYTNILWRKLVRTYKLFTGDMMWRTQTA